MVSGMRITVTRMQDLGTQYLIRSARPITAENLAELVESGLVPAECTVAQVERDSAVLVMQSHSRSW